MFRLLLFLILFIHSTALAMPPIMPLAEVQNGMNGTCYTVVESSGALESFNVKIIGTIQSAKSSSSYIMARASGELVQRTNGILQGMSGSPVYVNGKIIGALSKGWENMDPNIFLITPIEDMLKIWDLPDPLTLDPYAPPKNVEEEKVFGEEIFDKKELIDTAENIDAEEKNADEEFVGEEEIADEEEIAEEKAVFVYNGFNSAGLDFLKSSIPNFQNMTLATNDGTPNIRYDATLDGGYPVGLAIVCGDFSLGVTGTVTAVEGNKILAFGHPFAHIGNANFFMTDANIIGPVPGAPGGGMKMATVGNIIGRINQDREAGVSGIIGQFPSIVPINVTVNGETYKSIMAYHENLVAKLGAVIAYGALSKHADSLAESTVKIGFQIRTNAVEGGVLSRENIYYSPADVGQLAITELLSALTLVTSNATAENDILGIDVYINYEMARRTASLVKAEPVKNLIKPGESVELKVTLQPYRRPVEEIFVRYTVPIAAKEGKFVLDLHGGGLVPVAQVQQAGVIVPSTKSPAELYNEKIISLLRANKNNELIIKPAAVVKTEKELKEDIKRARKILAHYEKIGQKPPSIQALTKVSTNYIIDNIVQCTLNVDKL